MKKSSVSYRIIVNLKPFLRMERTGCKNCFIGAILSKIQWCLSPGKLVPDPFPPFHFVSFTLHTYGCCYSEESLGLTAPPEFHFLFWLRASEAQTGSAAQEPGRLGRRAPLSHQLDFPPSPFCPETSNTYSSPLCQLANASFFFLCHPPKQEPLFGKGNAVTRRSHYPGSRGLSCNNYSAIVRTTVSKLISARFSELEKRGYLKILFPLLDQGEVPSYFLSWLFLAFVLAYTWAKCNLMTFPLKKKIKGI